MKSEAEWIKEIKEVKKNTLICAVSGLILVAVYHYDPPGSMGATVLIRVIGCMNLAGAVLGCLTLLAVFRRKEKKNDPV